MTEPDELKRLIDEVDARTVHAALGIRVVTLARAGVVLEVDVTPKLFQHAGIVHGGVYVLLGEGACSALAALHVDIATHRVSGQEVNANHLRAVSEGRLVATARVIDAVGSTHVYGFEVRSGDDVLVSVGRCTIAVRPVRRGP